jgi:DNA-binding response OmpR family regulator
MKPLSIVVVEDNDVLRDITVDFLQNLGHDVRGVFDGESLDECLAQRPCDILVLDLNLPGEDGLSICQRLRRASPSIGIVMLTARAHALQRVQGYDSGADIYLAKPTANEELGAAVASLGRRLVKPPTNFLADGQTLQLQGPGGQEALTEADMKILRSLCMAPQQQLAYWQLLELLDMSPSEEAKSALEVRIARLRKKMVSVGMPEPTIKSVRRFGYQLTGGLQLI